MPFEIVNGDITKLNVDAIVNAANNTLLGGGGVDGAIHRAAGPELLKECMTLGGCETGQAKITKGYNLPAKYIIHTVGPIWQGGKANEPELLASCYTNSMKLATQYECETVAFPLISSGAYGYPKMDAMEIAGKTIKEYIREHDMHVFLVIFGHESFFRNKPLYQTVQEYIEKHYNEFAAEAICEGNSRYYAETRRRREWDFENHPPLESKKLSIEDVDWEEVINQTDKGFSQTLQDMIAARGIKDSKCYNDAQIDKRLFSKIKSDPQYRPSKPTVVAFAIALHLNLKETEALLETAGYSISNSSKFDLILRCCIGNRIYNVGQINEVLYEYDLPQMGSVANE